ncbi:hypothetical protein [Nocardioides jiangxiensis]|uniref:Transcriptional regulator, AbiEi antitoxin, Type IV TA system n=1 Tax=Nocardioides jiangxiensis TaxID=3064524 RepID=A0ABT9B6P6_9ACTN|nr:hypothetical protein [Nocardioides sp. WY-20]MDO7869267.1 hypothetical protein [Nocardioides sp. WY-20]
MHPAFLDHLLPSDLPLPHDRPFTYAEARDALGGRHAVSTLHRRGLLVSDVRSVYRMASSTDSLAMRIATLRLVVPCDAVVCDRSAAWLHGAEMALPPNGQLAPPPVDVFLPRNARLTNKVTHSGARTLAADDVMLIDGLHVTTALRTACDVGRLLPREQAMAVLDSLAATSRMVTPTQVMALTSRYRGFRGVRQLRDLAPRIDSRSQSTPESILRLRWQDCADLPAPTPQVAVTTPDGLRFLDLGVPSIKYGAEYDGSEFHGPEQAEHDAERRAWFAADGWIIDVLRRDNLFGAHQDWEHVLRRGIRRAQRRRTAPSAA